VLLDHEPARKILTPPFGRPTAGVEVGGVNELDHDVAVGSPGEMIIRDTEIMRRRGFFSGEAVLAWAILTEAMDANDAGDTLFDLCNAQLAYFNTPGWIYFVDSLPPTRRRKIQKCQLFPGGSDPCSLLGVFNRRKRERRNSKIGGR
jgi:hypothetical protein